MTRANVMLVLVLSASLALGGCVSLEQMNRDRLRYRAIDRGYEIYKLTNIDSLEAALKRNEQEIDLYEKHRNAYLQRPGQQRGSDSQSDKPTSILPESRPAQTLIAPEARRRTQTESVWPVDLISSAKDSTTTKYQDGKPVEVTRTSQDEKLVSVLSSSTAIVQMRDLLTEPSFPTLLPIDRTITRLGCLPPPESAAFEAVLKLEASLKKAGESVTLGTEFASSVVKLFEESERTLFLQYALFRLCEMSINAPSGFRNVYPVVVHDIVRRTAEMNELATKEAELRRTEEEKTRQRMIDLKLKEKEIEAYREKRFTDCVVKRLDNDASDVASIRSDCGLLVKADEPKKEEPKKESPKKEGPKMEKPKAGKPKT